MRALYNFKLSGNQNINLFDFYKNNDCSLINVILCDHLATLPWQVLNKIVQCNIFVIVSYFGNISVYSEKLLNKCTRFKRLKHQKNKISNAELDAFVESRFSNSADSITFTPNQFKIQFIRLLYKYCNKEILMFLNLLNDQKNENIAAAAQTLYERTIGYLNNVS